MGWRGTVVLLAIVLVAGGYLLLAAPPDPEAPEESPTLLGEPRLYDPNKFVALLPFQPSAVTSVRVRHGDLELAARRAGEGWEGGPDDDRVDGFLHALSELGRVMEIPATQEVLRDYGLDVPRSVVELTLAGGDAPVVVQVGNQNPAGTGVYVHIGGEQAVILAGALLSWELDKLFRRLAD